MSSKVKSQIILDRGLATAIGRSIPSTKSKSGFISHTYVIKVLNGQRLADNPTTRAIKAKAKAIVEALNA